MSAIAEPIPVTLPTPRRAQPASALATLARRRAALTASKPRHNRRIAIIPGPRACDPQHTQPLNHLHRVTCIIRLQFPLDVGA